MKNVIWSVVTICFILLINWGVAALFNVEFIDFAFISGLGVAVIIWFFTSSGGFISNSIRMQTQAQTGIKMEEEKRSFNPSVTFYTAVVYTIIAAVVTFIYYKDYFIG
ncbi:hypothetical protein [Virgibacillus doumboii]|uniref:hypothetical protein n=1 Tax=Virgibacillus doumboii TaxID=2697503 RepID=UPI0013E06D92|nr:hypothetical protein [Virgibacillus doumboii]